MSTMNFDLFRPIFPPFLSFFLSRASRGGMKSPTLPRVVGSNARSVPIECLLLLCGEQSKSVKADRMEFRAIGRSLANARRQFAENRADARFGSKALESTKRGPKGGLETCTDSRVGWCRLQHEERSFNLTESRFFSR